MNSSVGIRKIILVFELFEKDINRIRRDDLVFIFLGVYNIIDSE